MRKTVGVVSALAVAAGLVWVAGIESGGEDSFAGRSGPVIGHGKDRMPSSTASDWVTYADHVVVATAVGDKEVPPSAGEIERGEGMIGRNVSMKVEKVLWSRPSPAQPAPDTYVRPSSGWVFKGGVGNRHEYALAERPRIEVGHHYVIALAWSPAKCSEGDKPEPAQWVGLGEGSTVPYDEGVIGRGEMEGRQQAAAARESGVTALAAVEGKLEEKLAGRSADALVAALKTAEPSQNRATAPAARSLRGTCS